MKRSSQQAQQEQKLSSDMRPLPGVTSYTNMLQILPNQNIITARNLQEKCHGDRAVQNIRPVNAYLHKIITRRGNEEKC